MREARHRRKIFIFLLGGGTARLAPLDPPLQGYERILLSFSFVHPNTSHMQIIDCQYYLKYPDRRNSLYF